MVKEIIQIGNQHLLTPSESIKESEISQGWVQDLARDLIDTCKFHVKAAAGLSAVQLDVLKRMFAVRRLDLEENWQEENDENIIWEVMINPELELLSETPVVEWEGCMSINSGKSRLFGPVERPDKVKLTYTNLKGQNVSLKSKGFFSHLLQHEMDHLNGILFLSHIDNLKNVWKEEELDKYLSEHKNFPEIIQD